MKSLVRLGVPVVILLAILLIGSALRIVLGRAVPDSFEHTAIGNMVTSLAALVVSVYGIYFAIRMLREFAFSRSHGDFSYYSSNDSSTPVPSIDIDLTHRSKLTGVPANGILHLERLSEDPKTRANLADLRKREKSRRIAS